MPAYPRKHNKRLYRAVKNYLVNECGLDEVSVSIIASQHIDKVLDNVISKHLSMMCLEDIILKELTAILSSTSKDWTCNYGVKDFRGYLQSIIRSEVTRVVRECIVVDGSANIRIGGSNNEDSSDSSN